jgi:succinate dehydrogenase / fumarate reductase flavoprotein subunit/L-aspartate oxidase
VASDPITESRGRVDATRAARKGQPLPLLPQTEKEALLHKYHPDYKAEAYRLIRVGTNAGQKTVHEVADLLEGDSPVTQADLKAEPDYITDLLILGGGGAGCAAALTARASGAKVLLATKLRLGDSNTVMAEGGMQVAVKPEDSPVRHFLDTIKGGHFANDRQLLKVLVEEGPAATQWLLSLGVLFDRDETGNLKVRSGGATSTPRLLTCKDYTGLELMRVLKDALINEDVQIVEFAPAVELLSDGTGRCVGAILKNLDNGRFLTVHAKAVILATGGSGRLHIQGFPTSNHFGATGDALPLAYRMGAELAFIDTFQYHPTGAIYPEPMAGLLVTEAIRAAGSQLVNRLGERFVNETDTRDVVAAAIIRECAEGRGVSTPSGRRGVWLDTPMVDLLNGEGTLDTRFPNMRKLFSRYDIDIRSEAVLIHPTLHYQNGGVKIGVNGDSTVPGLFVAGEASGGLHGRNRLMGNSLLDIIVFGRRAGQAAAAHGASAGAGAATLEHLTRFRRALKEAGVASSTPSPRLIPDYVRRETATSRS